MGKNKHGRNGAKKRKSEKKIKAPQVEQVQIDIAGVRGCLNAIVAATEKSRSKDAKYAHGIALEGLAILGGNAVVEEAAA